ncbi:MAG: glycosyltransferase family 25 protein [Alphaproteobacteria bacterium]|nr:glycosyltransferase family 25 protein [Alphaproteobacteria bacterium]MBP6366715.1 glycosyltransferase family 25 protein [Nitrosomonas sp.]
MIKSYIINLDRHPERLEIMNKRFADLGIPYQKISAIDGRQISDLEFSKFADARPGVQACGKWSKGKMGCFLSHFQARKLAAESPCQYTAIFEDDMWLADNIVDFLRNTEWIPRQADIVRLEAPGPWLVMLSKKDKRRHHGRDVQRVLPNTFKHAWPIGNGGYIISKAGAQKFMEAPIDKHMHMDQFTYNTSISELANELCVYQLNPACCIQDKYYHKDASKIKFESDIEINASENEALYDTSVGVKRSIISLAKKIGILQPFKKLRRLYYYLHGCRKVYFSA